MNAGVFSLNLQKLPPVPQQDIEIVPRKPDNHVAPILTVYCEIVSYTETFQTSSPSLPLILSTSSVLVMSDRSPATVIGCLLDVSGSMHEVLETGSSDERAIERLRAVLCAALKLAQAEHRRNPHALVFVGVFGLNRDADCLPVVDLCGVVDGLSTAVTVFSTAVTITGPATNFLSHWRTRIT